VKAAQSPSASFWICGLILSSANRAACTISKIFNAQIPTWFAVRSQ
jgi:hypothetical protein